VENPIRLDSDVSIVNVISRYIELNAPMALRAGLHAGGGIKFFIRERIENH